jgi:hypothetical protein
MRRSFSNKQTTGRVRGALKKRRAAGSGRAYCKLCHVLHKRCPVTTGLARTPPLPVYSSRSVILPTPCVSFSGPPLPP